MTQGEQRIAEGSQLLRSRVFPIYPFTATNRMYRTRSVPTLPCAPATRSARNPPELAQAVSFLGRNSYSGWCRGSQTSEGPACSIDPGTARKRTGVIPPQRPEKTAT